MKKGTKLLNGLRFANNVTLELHDKKVYITTQGDELQTRLQTTLPCIAFHILGEL